MRMRWARPTRSITRSAPSTHTERRSLPACSCLLVLTVRHMFLTSKTTARTKFCASLSLPSFALERRHGEFVTVAANETVDDTLLASGNTVRVEGVVNGDLLAFGR